jgi:hypothetical protein
VLEPDRGEVEKCWELLPHPSGTVIRVFARNRATGELDGDFARNAGEMFYFARANVDRQVYVCPNPCREGTAGVRHTAKDVTHWSYLLIDMDPIEDVFDPEPALEEALLWLGEWNGRDFGPRGQRPLIIDSGRGRQAWIRLEDITMMDTKMIDWHPELQERSVARKVNGYWLGKLTDKLGMCHGCKVDTSTSDLPRPMRMPGTFNQKTGRMARIVESGAGPYSGLAHVMVSQVPKEKLVEPDVVPIAPGLPWQMAMHRLTLSAKKYLKEGQEEPGRHKVCWHTARKLRELGVSRAEARKALTQANRLKGEGQALSFEEIEHALDTAEGT